VSNCCALASESASLEQAVRVKPPVFDVVDTVGAGDSFQSALLARLAQDADPKSAVSSLDAERLDDLPSYALKAASITCSRRGAELPRSAEILPEDS